MELSSWPGNPGYLSGREGGHAPALRRVTSVRESNSRSPATSRMSEGADIIQGPEWGDEERGHALLPYLRAHDAYTLDP